MSDTSKKKKKNNLKLKKVKRKINNNNIKEKALTVDIPLIKSTHQILSSINSELDDLSNNIKFNNIFKKAFPSSNELNILSFPLSAYNNNYNSNFNYDKEDFEIKELINKANFYLSNNNLNKQFIKNYENKICQANNYYIPRFNNFFNKNNENNGYNNLKFNFNNNIRNINNLRNEFDNKFFQNNLLKIRKRNKTNYKPFYNSTMGKYKIRNNSQRYILKNTLNKNINQKTKKLENINLFFNTNKRRPLVYSQIDHSKQSDAEIIPIMRNFSEKNKYLKFKEKNKKFSRINNDKAIDILKEKI